MDHNDGFLKIVRDAKTRIRELSVEQVRAKQERKEDFVFVDVREDSEWAKGHAAGAIHLGKGVIERDVEQAIPDRDREVILYCGGGFRSALAADVLQRMGYLRVSSMDGGIKLWRERGYPIDE